MPKFSKAEISTRGYSDSKEQASVSGIILTFIAGKEHSSWLKSLAFSDTDEMSVQVLYSVQVADVGNWRECTFLPRDSTTVREVTEPLSVAMAPRAGTNEAKE